MRVGMAREIKQADSELFAASLRGCPSMQHERVIVAAIMFAARGGSSTSRNKLPRRQSYLTASVVLPASRQLAGYSDGVFFNPIQVTPYRRVKPDRLIKRLR